MSSSEGNPSNKIPWYRKMMANLDRDSKNKEAERRANIPKEGAAERRKKKLEETLAGK